MVNEAQLSYMSTFQPPIYCNYLGRSFSSAARYSSFSSQCQFIYLRYFLGIYISRRNITFETGVPLSIREFGFLAWLLIVGRTFLLVLHTYSPLWLPGIIFDELQQA